LSNRGNSALNDGFEYQGHWWLPGEAGDKVPGILKFDPDDGATLDLLGSLKGLEGVIELLEPKIILGLSSNGRRITLHECDKSLGNLVIGSGFSTSSFAVSTIFVGEHFERAEDVGFERLMVEYLHLDAWANVSGFAGKFCEEGEEPKRRRMEVRHKRPEPFTADVGVEYEVTLDFGSDFVGSPLPITWVNILQPSELAIKFPQKETFGRLSDIAFRLQHFVSLGTRTSAYPVAVRGYTGIPGEAIPVEVHYRPLGRTDTPQKRPELFEMLFSRRDLPEGFGPAVAGWLEGAEKLDPVYRLFLGTVYNPRAFIEQQFLSLVTALEVYHRRVMSTPDPQEEHEQRKREILEAVPNEHRGWLDRVLKHSHEPDLAQRFHEIFRKHLKVVQAIVGRSKKSRANFIQEVVDGRHYRAHFDKRFEGKATRGVDLHPINQKLTKLLEACLMAEIGFEDDKIREAVLSLR
jgi:hypothetical protein